MTPSAAEILTNPHPRGHIVYPYTDEAQVAGAVGLFAGAGLRNGEAVLLIMTSSHSRPIRQHLEDAGFNLQDREASGQLICENAEDLLSSLLLNGVVGELPFKAKLGSMIENAATTGDGALCRPVRIFGEMVDLLWRKDSAMSQRIEELWNDVIEAHSVALMCAYSLAGTKPREFPHSLLACHSYAIA